MLASAELGEGDEDKRPTVQVGDPFAEKKLMECSLELLERGLIVSLQDLGAAGLTSSASEMASKGEVGIDLDVARVPLREAGMEPFEIMVSESQERMLCVCEPARLDEVLAVCATWEVHGTAIGEVTASGHMRVFDGDRLVGDMPVAALVDDCPLYDLAPERPERAALPGGPAAARPRRRAGARRCSRSCARRTSPRACRSSGSTTGSCSRAPCAGRRRPTRPCCSLPAGRRRPALAVSIDGNGRRVAADPYRGTVEVVLECAANLACVGAEPLGVTNNLNFGNPEKPHVAWQLTEAVRGLGDAVRALETAVVGGNVSLYNEGAAGPIYPTPVVGMVGRLPDARRAGRLGFAAAGRRGRDRRRVPPVARRERAAQAVRRAAARRPARRRRRRGPRRPSRPSATRCARGR